MTDNPPNLIERLIKRWLPLPPRWRSRHSKFMKHIRASLSLNRYYYLSPTQAMVRLLDGAFIYVDPCDEAVSANLIAHGCWEPNVTKVVSRLTKPGSVVVEVGANLGYFSIVMARRVGSGGRLVTFEANPKMAEFTRKSLLLNGLIGRVQVIEKAASDSEGTVEFMISRQYAGSGHILVPESRIAPDEAVISVGTIPLDYLDIDKVDFIRMDAEGSEPLILRGAERLLSNPNIIVCMEWSPIQMRSRASVPELVTWLTQMGFRFWRIEPDSRILEIHSSLLPSIDHCELDSSLLPSIDHCELVMSRKIPDLPLTV